MAGNPLVDMFRVKDLRKRILYTLGILLVYRLGSVLPIPGIDVHALKNYFEQQANTGTSLGLVEYLNFFAGGAFKQSSIFMLGVMPYITMSIVMQLLLIVFPSLKKIQEEEGGRKKITKITRYGTVALCLVQGFASITWIKSIDVINRSFSTGMFYVVALITITTGTMFVLWMGEQITQKGVGNGVSLIIFSGIVSKMPNAFSLLIDEVRSGNLNPIFILITVMLFVVVIIAVIYEQQGQRRIPINYAKRAGANTYIPFKVNPSGVIPVIFASSITAIIPQLAKMLGNKSAGWAKFAEIFAPHSFPYLIVLTLLIVFFAYFYTQVTVNPLEIAKNIRENGGSIPGIRSEHMESHLTRILNRILLPGSLFLALIALIPSLIIILFQFPQQVAYLMGGTSLLIMVGVDLDTMSQIEGHLKMHHHDGLVKKGKLRSSKL
ncbi:preprotein translocase subunit SecY [Thiospirochaeta perfilievii]|uniref:Protein translocase subunit SecY n=1 Tax=Thiospirochaeta perfilievii TaxID=252967 RepID=A0A5C1QEW4_9SPIO|nr:preprotein translocase subunit SecY [Thiospirochaeta perfilievii]QEN05176.1 preprotein translocase subunit SecY [Thiospirochaeta perfilievii]